MRTRSNISLKVCLVIGLLLVGLTLSGCYGATSTPAGWSGAVIADGTLFLCPGLKQIGGGGCSTPIYENKLVALDISDGSKKWEYPSPESTKYLSGAVYGSPVVEDGRVYITAYSGEVVIIYVDTLSPGGVYLDVDNPQPIIGGPVIAEGKVYVGSSDGKVYALVYDLDAKNLKPVWGEPFATGDKIWSTPAIDGDTLYIGSFDKKLYAVNISDGTKKWEFETEGAIIATPLVYDNSVYFGSFDRYFYAVDATTGSLKWKTNFAAGSWFWANAVIGNDTIYAPCLDGKVYALDAQTGNKIAEFDLESPISSSPVLVDNLVIVASQVGGIYAIDTTSNQIKWAEKVYAGEVYTPEAEISGTTTIYAPLCAGDGVVYLYSQGQWLYALNAESGEKLWSLSLK